MAEEEEGFQLDSQPTYHWLKPKSIAIGSSSLLKLSSLWAEEWIKEAADNLLVEAENDLKSTRPTLTLLAQENLLSTARCAYGVSFFDHEDVTLR